MVFGLLLTLVGIGALCALLYNAAVYALPVGIGIWVGYELLHWGSNPVAAIFCGFLAVGLAFALGHMILGLSRSNLLRYATVAAFVVPAIVAGYSTALDLSTIGFTSAFLQHVLGVIGAVAVGGTTFVRLLAPAENTTANI